jgi:hypothetical protein
LVCLAHFAGTCSSGHVPGFRFSAGGRWAKKPVLVRQMTGWGICRGHGASGRSNSAQAHAQSSSGGQSSAGLELGKRHHRVSLYFSFQAIHRALVPHTAGATPIHPSMPDRFIWKWTPNQQYFASSAYRVFFFVGQSYNVRLG